MLDIARTRDLIRTRVLARDLDVARDLSIPNVLDLDLARASTLDLALGITYALDLTHTFAFTRVLNPSHFSYLAQKIEQVIGVTQSSHNSDVELRQILGSILYDVETIRRIAEPSKQISQIWKDLIASCKVAESAEAVALTNAPEIELLTVDTLASIVDNLICSNDEKREQARKVLMAEHVASALGQAVIEQMAILKHMHADNPQIRTLLEDALQGVIYDTPLWIVDWMEQAKMAEHVAAVETIFSQMRLVTPQTFGTILDILPYAGSILTCV